VKQHRVSFHFDDRSAIPLKDLEARGMKFEEIKLPDRTLVIPKVARCRFLICPAWEILALLSGSKSQVRRPVKPQPRDVLAPWPNDASCICWEDFLANPAYFISCGYCPFGAPGDLLIVRETFCLQCDIDGDPPPFDDGRPIKVHRAESEEYYWNWLQPHYKATDPEPELSCDWRKCDNDDPHGHWRSPATMPRWASRITLEVVEVLAPQRVRGMDGSQCIEEGIVPPWGDKPLLGSNKTAEDTPRGMFAQLWDSRYARRGFPWDTAWCWRAKVKMVKP
jgi:hypothetical protein